jgi:hypothetical protein
MALSSAFKKIKSTFETIDLTKDASSVGSGNKGGPGCIRDSHGKRKHNQDNMKTVQNTSQLN